MAKRYGEDEAVRYWRAQGEAVTELAAFIAGNGIDCDVTGEGNLCVAHSARTAAGLADEVAHARTLGLDLDFIDADTFRAEIHDGPETFGAIRSRPAFGVHPLKLVLGMADAAARAGATIATASQVVRWTREGGRHVLAIRGGGRVCASRVIVATNGYTPNGLSRALDSRIVPAISSIVVSQPYSAAELDARGFRSQTPIYNSRELLFYYRRLPGGRILFGERGDRSGTLQAAGERSLIALADLHRILPAFADARIAYAWRGLVCLTARRVMAVGLDPDDPTTAFAFGCHGSGVATMSGAGRLAADLVAGAVREADVPAPARGLPPRLPGSDLCLRWGLGAAYRWAAWQDGG
jgi:glycine/D-amino acid oxidase-like deaminating enzyme